MEQSQGRMSRQRFVLISILFFHSVNTYMDRACIASAIDHIMKDLSMSAELMGLVLGIFAVGYALFQVPSGWIADKLGPRKALTIVVSPAIIFYRLFDDLRSAGRCRCSHFLFCLVNKLFHNSALISNTNVLVLFLKSSCHILLFPHLLSQV